MPKYLLLVINLTHLMFRWNAEIQEGIYAMLEMLVDLVTTRLERDPVPCGLLDTLALVSLFPLNSMPSSTLTLMHGKFVYTFINILFRHLTLTMIGIARTKISSRKVDGKML